MSRRKGTGSIHAALGRFCSVDEWTVPPRFPVFYADNIRRQGVTLNVCGGAFFPERTLKTPDEVENIAESMRATEEAMRLVHDLMAEAKVKNSGELVRPDGEILTCEFIRCEVEAFFKRKGFTARQTIIACGRDAAAPHNIGFGPVMKSEPVVADIFPRSDRTGYWGDMTRTFCKGKAPEIVTRIQRRSLASETAEST